MTRDTQPIIEAVFKAVDADLPIIETAVRAIEKAREDGSLKYTPESWWRETIGSEHFIHAWQHIASMYANPPTMPFPEKKERVAHAICRLSMYLWFLENDRP